MFRRYFEEESILRQSFFLTTFNGLPDFTFSSFLLVSSIVTAVRKTLPNNIRVKYHQNDFNIYNDE